MDERRERIPESDSSSSPGRQDSSAIAPQPPLASWYAQGLTDGVGDRLLMFDNTGAASLELLRFRADLAAAPGFEAALRQTVERLAGFEHPAFPQARAVERLDGGQVLALVSTHVPGKRLSEMFQIDSGRQSGVHPAYVARIVQQLIGALADLSAYGGVPHGVLTVDRIVLTPEGGLVIVEHVLGSALGRLALTPAELWREFRIVVPPAPPDTPPLNGRTDLFQLASIALSLLVGRRLTPEDHAERVEHLLDRLAADAGGYVSAIMPALCVWLRQALGIGGNSFDSIEAARTGAHALSGSGQAASPVFVDQPTLSRFAAPVLPVPVLDVVRPAASGRVLALSGETVTPDVDPRRHLRTRRLALGLAALAAVQALAIARLLTSTPATVPTRDTAATDVTASLALSEPARPNPETRATPLGPPAASTGTGSETGRTPVREAPPAPAPTAAAPAVVDEAAARPRGDEPTPPAPVETQVLDDPVLGSGADGPTVAPPVQPADAQVSINALPWADVWIDGTAVGETPLAHVPVASGTREIVFRHPRLGERRQTIVVQPGADLRVSTTFEP